MRSGGQTGYLRMDGGSALPVAHFDVAGTRSPKGLKGFLYGERGIWRPGDTMHLTFVLLDTTKRLAADHPVRFDLVDPRGQLVRSLTRTQSTDGFYTFDVATAPDAPTGNYNGRVSVGGATFEKTLKVETVMPNRLKIAMDFGTDELAAKSRLSGSLTSAWLHGAPARSLKADVELALTPARTSFKRFEEYVFDDPTRKYQTERQKIFEGNLDETGHARIDAAVQAEALAPGKLRADLTTRVFEPGGAFSIDRFSIPYSPYTRYVGLRTPKGDKTRGMLLTDTKHHVDIALLNPDGSPAGDGDVELKLYKVEWRWWWEKGEENLAAWADASVHTPLQSGVVKVKNGAGAWELEIKYPEWGRYLVTAEDKAGGHRAGQTLYIDWPGWAGRGQKEGGAGSQCPRVRPRQAGVRPRRDGDAHDPDAPERARPREPRVGLARAEDRVDRGQGQETRYTFTASPEMSPNVYAHVTLLQPHAQTANDLPIRLYGIAPIRVVNPQTRLQPVLEVPEVLPPETTSEVAVREATGRPMTYTLAVVDEGLLGLTRFETPNPWNYFYAREALAVRTWDLYDDVLGAYGAAMERMLAVGGDEAGVSAKGRRANRFPAYGPLPRAVPARGEGDQPAQDRDPAVRGRGARDAGGRARRCLRRHREVGVRAPAADAARDAAARARPRGERGAARLGLRPGAEGEGRGARPSRRRGRSRWSRRRRRRLAFSAVGDEVITFRLRTKPGLGRRDGERHRHLGHREGQPDDRARRAQLDRPGHGRDRRDRQAGRVVDATGRSSRASPGRTRRRSRSRASRRSTSAGASSTCWPTRTAASSRRSRPRSRSSSSGSSSSSRPRSGPAPRRTSRPRSSACGASRPRAAASATGPATTTRPTGPPTTPATSRSRRRRPATSRPRACWTSGRGSRGAARARGWRARARPSSPRPIVSSRSRSRAPRSCRP